MSIHPDFIAQAACGNLFGSPIQPAEEICVDSRLVQKDYCFFALPGEHHDGHSFIQEVIDRGACGIVISHKVFYDELPENYRSKVWCILVENTAQALIDTAHAWRSLFNIPVIGITGTVGKTTTKEYIGSLLSEVGINALITKGSMNGLIGLPLTLLRLRKHHEVAVCEVGISETGEMEVLSKLLRPTIGVITAIGKGHLQGLTSVKNVAIEKQKLFSHLQPNGIRIINGDQKLLSREKNTFALVSYGKKKTNDIQARGVKYFDDSLSCILKIDNKKYPFVLKTVHEGLLYTIMAVIAIAKKLNLQNEEILQALQKIPKTPGRFELLTCKDKKTFIINDSYNANPESMKAGIKAFDRMHCNKQKMLVIGDMLELGKESKSLHRTIGKIIGKTDTLSNVICIGSHMNFIKDVIPSRIKTTYVVSSDDAIPYVEKALSDGYAIMLKGSRGMLLDRIIKSIKNTITLIPYGQ